MAEVQLLPSVVFHNRPATTCLHKYQLRLRRTNMIPFICCWQTSKLIRNTLCVVELRLYTCLFSVLIVDNVRCMRRPGRFHFFPCRFFCCDENFWQWCRITAVLEDGAQCLRFEKCGAFFQRCFIDGKLIPMFFPVPKSRKNCWKLGLLTGNTTEKCLDFSNE